MVQIKHNKNQAIFCSSDAQGDFEIRVHKDCLQIQFATSIGNWDNECYANINRYELEQLYLMIGQILEMKE